MSNKLCTSLWYLVIALVGWRQREISVSVVSLGWCAPLMTAIVWTIVALSFVLAYVQQWVVFAGTLDNEYLRYVPLPQARQTLSRATMARAT